VDEVRDGNFFSATVSGHLEACISYSDTEVLRFGLAVEGETEIPGFALRRNYRDAALVEEGGLAVNYKIRGDNV
jgi:hypothetical protein